MSVLMGLGIYAGFLALLLCGYWAYGVVEDRRHSRRLVEAFDRYVAATEVLKEDADD